MPQVDDLMKLADEAIHSYAAWLAEFTMGDLQSLNVMRLRDESDAARRKLQDALTSAIGGVIVGDGTGQALPPVSQQERTADGVLLPCPVCGGEAVHAQDVLARTVINPAAGSSDSPKGGR